MPNLEDAAKSLKEFEGSIGFTQKIAYLEACVRGMRAEEIRAFLSSEGITKSFLDSAFLLKSTVGQSTVLIRAIVILLSLPHILEDGEVVEYVCLRTDDTEREFDLETDRRVARFKFIQWEAGLYDTRRGRFFMDFLKLAEYHTGKRRCLCVLGVDAPLRLLSGKQLISGIRMTADVRKVFAEKYGERYARVSEYYRDAGRLVEIIDLTQIVPELAGRQQYWRSARDSAASDTGLSEAADEHTQIEVIDVVWARILAHQGEVFHAFMGREFTYTVSGKRLYPSTTEKAIPRSSFEAAIRRRPLLKASELYGLPGPWYIFALLKDPRILGG